jgi:hypothetical protein
MIYAKDDGLIPIFSSYPYPFFPGLWKNPFFFQPDGSILGYFGNAFYRHRGLGQRGNLRVPRKILRKILVQTLQHTTIHWGHQFIESTWREKHQQYFVQFAACRDDNDNGGERVIVEVTADLIVAADGIRSAVLGKLVYEKQQSKSESPERNLQEKNNGQLTGSKDVMGGPTMGLRRMGVRLILGIADFTHPLLDERGFYTLDGTHRLFTMPYQSNTRNRVGTVGKNTEHFKSRIMWQLSFATDLDFDESLEKSHLRDFAMETCRDWHSPVLDMIQATPLEKIWGTWVWHYDRNYFGSL